MATTTTTIIPADAPATAPEARTIVPTRVDRTRTVSIFTAITAVGFLLALAALHVLKSDLSPTWRMVSEYEIGRHGWLMQTAFLMLAASTIGASTILQPVTQNRAGRVGRGALIVTAAGLVLAAFATADQITATADELTTHGNLHGLGAMLGVPGTAIAAIALTRSVRTNPRYARPIRIASYIVLAALAVFVASMIAMFRGAPSTPEVRIGLQNRSFVVAHAAWLLVAANLASQRNR